MKAGQRVTLIKETGMSLAQYEWADLDLILRQFGFPWSDSWQGDDRYGYALAHIENGDDQKLLELNQFLTGGESNQPELAEITGPWRPQRFRLFASHIHDDKIAVSDLKKALERYGIDTFVAHEDIQPTKEWESEIAKGLDTCDALAAFLTPQFHGSLWVDQEVGYCMSRRVLIIPLRLGANPYGFIAKYQGLQCAGRSVDEVAEEIFDLLITHDLTASTMASGLMGRFEEAESYDDANRLARLLRDKIGAWTPELLRRLENAPRANRQVNEAWSAKRIVPEILKEHAS
jgi:TIR domain